MKVKIKTVLASSGADRRKYNNNSVLHRSGTVYTYITWIHDKILDWPSSIPFINRLVLRLETSSYERRNLVKSLCEGFCWDTRSHHKAAKPLGLSAVAWSQSKHFLPPSEREKKNRCYLVLASQLREASSTPELKKYYPLVERGMQMKQPSWGNRDPSETQRT
jgi:hypothetical protein